MIHRNNQSNTEIDGTALAQIETFDTFGCDVSGKNPDTPDLLKPLLDANGEEIRVPLTPPIDLLPGLELLVPDIPPELAAARFITELAVTRLPEGITPPPHFSPTGDPRDFLLMRYEREFFKGKLQLPDGGDMKYWGFLDPGLPSFEDEIIGKGAFSHLKGGPLPSQTLFLLEGCMVQVTFHSKKNTHTIHLHGIEPTTFNDGVGHTSFEISGSYTYQFFASQPGTYAYHCHKNTVLHFEMGMWGPLITIPAAEPPLFGPKLVPVLNAPTPLFRPAAYQKGVVVNGDESPFTFDGVIGYQVDAFDPTWRELGHSAGLCGEDAGLNDYNPTVFVINGVPANQDNPENSLTLTSPLVSFVFPQGAAIFCQPGNLSYTVLRVTFGMAVKLVEFDGRQCGGQTSVYSHPFDIPAGTPFDLTTSQRFPLFIDTSDVGTFLVSFEYRHWITGNILGVAKTTITVLPPPMST